MTDEREKTHGQTDKVCHIRGKAGVARKRTPRTGTAARAGAGHGRTHKPTKEGLPRLSVLGLSGDRGEVLTIPRIVVRDVLKHSLRRFIGCEVNAVNALTV